MRIAQLSPSYPSPTCGISTYTGYLAEALHALSDVIVVGNPNEIDVRSVDLVHVQHTFDLYGYMGVQTFGLYRALRQTGLPIVSTLHELPPRTPQTLKARLSIPYLLACLDWIIRHSDAVIVHSAGDRDYLSHQLSVQKVRVIPHGTLAHAAEPVALNELHTPPVIGFFGFLSSHKGVHHLIDAAAALPETRWVIAGAPRTHADAEYSAGLQNEVARRGLAGRVSFPGFVADEALAEFFAQVDLLVFPYHQGTASGALSLALAHQRVILASDLPVFQELKEVYGCLETFALDRPTTLVDRLRELLASPARRAALRAGCAQHREFAAWPAVAQATYALYETVCAHAGRQEVLR